MKVRSSVKPICEKCKVIKRKGSIRINLRKSEAQTASGLIAGNKVDLEHELGG